MRTSLEHTITREQTYLQNLQLQKKKLTEGRFTLLQSFLNYPDRNVDRSFSDARALRAVKITHRSRY